jgi:hypothetical protein
VCNQLIVFFFFGLEIQIRKNYLEGVLTNAWHSQNILTHNLKRTDAVWIVRKSHWNFCWSQHLKPEQRKSIANHEFYFLTKIIMINQQKKKEST